MNKLLGSLVIAGSAMGLTPAAVSAERWIHVRVDDTGDSGVRVDIQVPVELVATILPALEGEHVHAIHVDGREVDLAEWRRSWNALRAAKDGDYLTVRDPQSDVRISKSGGFLRLTVDDRNGGSRVRMKVPVRIVDAVLAGGDAIDRDTLSRALGEVPLGDVLTLDDEDSHVRVWVDTATAPARKEGR